MMTDKELTEYKTPCQYIAGKLIPCVVVISHLEANAEIELLQGAISALKPEIERLEVIIKDDQFVLKLSDNNFLLARDQVEKLRARVDLLNSRISIAKAVFGKFEHLDHLFSDPAWLANNAISQALADAWTVIKILAELDGKKEK